MMMKQSEKPRKEQKRLKTNDGPLRANKLQAVLKEERISISMIERYTIILAETANKKIENPKDHVKHLYKQDISKFVNGRRWTLNEITASKILLAINKHRHRDNKFTLEDLFEPGRIY